MSNEKVMEGNAIVAGNEHNQRGKSGERKTVPNAISHYERRRVGETCKPATLLWPNGTEFFPPPTTLFRRVRWCQTIRPPWGCSNGVWFV